MNRNTILIVDDMEINRVILRSLFEQEYNLLEAENGEQALMLLEQYHDTLAAMLLDLVMPVKDGYEVLSEIAKSGRTDVPVIVITSENSAESEMRVFDMGASDIIGKPFEPHVVRRRVQNTVELNRHRLHLEEMVEEQAVRLRESKEILMDTLSSVIEHRSAETGQHVLRIRMFTKVLLEDVMRCYPEYGLTEHSVGVIASAASLHDIGKISIPDAILNKPGPLTREEFNIMKTHTVKGCEILAGLDRMDDKEYLGYAYNICRFHHERWDGRGYPDGRKGDMIPICAQAAGIADAYDALTTDRVYKKAFPPEKAFSMILNGECGAFSPKLLECLKNVRDQFQDLTKKYADGHSPKADGRLEVASLPDRPMESVGTLELGQMKYFAMLRYVGSTVMEVDPDSGVYHLVYQKNDDFQLLRTGGNFEESMRTFIEIAVHPEDRPEAYGTLEKFPGQFLMSGELKRTWRYRIYNRDSGEYIWYENTVLRVDLQDLRQHRVLLVWRQDQEDTAAKVETKPRDIQSVQNLKVGICQCLNDRQLTLVDVNEGFFHLFGYSRRELEQRFENQYLPLVHPEDREMVIHSIRNKLLSSEQFELEYRGVAKDGRQVWILDQCQLAAGTDGQEYLCSVLIDITNRKQAQDELRLTLERHQVIMDQTNDIIFEWDIPTDHIHYSSNWHKIFGYEPVSDSVSSRLLTASRILPEDLPQLLALMEKVKKGKPYGEAELRIAKADGQYLWCRVRATTQFDHYSGKPIKAVGVILNIDSEKRRAQELLDRAEKDSLTSLYNKSAAFRKIRLLLSQWEEQELAAMFILDMDNFKLVNDSFGHMFGDAVLAEIASRLKRLFQVEDIVARIGGDEFLVFMRHVRGEQAVREKLAEVLEAFQKEIAGGMESCPLSCSIGVAYWPGTCADFQDLFSHCDQALYHAKLSGKSRYLFYDGENMENPFGRDAPYALAASTRIESDDSNNFDSDGIVSQAFQKLYESGDVKQAVNSILELVGRKFNVSRVYIFEDSKDGAHCSNTFEWCNEGVKPEIDTLQNISYEELGGNYQDNFNENGIFYCPDISYLPQKQVAVLAPQGIRSMLQCAVRDGGRFVGYVGFDDCTMTRLWTQNQIDALTFISELISTFLMKQRAQDRALQTAENMRMMMDHQNSWIYVIDPDSYELYYINAKTYQSVPDVQMGMRCYKAFFNQDKPCDPCPAKNIRTCINQTLEVYNPILKVWSIADASFIHWGSQDACLLCCHDVTQYKEACGEGREKQKSAR